MKIFKNREQGFTLVEVLIAIAILGIISTAIFLALQVSSKSAALSDERTSAESLARSELEYVKNSIYIPAGWQYQLPSTPPPWDPGHVLAAQYAGFAVNVLSAPVHAGDDGLQMITVVVHHGAKTVFTLSGYKTQI
jgi:prepilin-type N-terminal cleavage/methylation domain-containing protein